jgi:hypothetical protein
MLTSQSSGNVKERPGGRPIDRSGRRSPRPPLSCAIGYSASTLASMLWPYPAAYPAINDVRFSLELHRPTLTCAFLPLLASSFPRNKPSRKAALVGCCSCSVLEKSAFAEPPIHLADPPAKPTTPASNNPATLCITLILTFNLFSNCVSED